MTTPADYLASADDLTRLQQRLVNAETFYLLEDHALTIAINLLKQAAEYRKAVDTLMAISDALGDVDD